VALTAEQRSELSTLVSDRSVDAVVAGRARMVLWRDDGYSAEQVAALAGVSRPTVNTWVRRYAEAGLVGLYDQPRPGKPVQVPGAVRARILALTRTSPPAGTGVTHWSSRTLAGWLARHEGITVSHNFIAELWREHGLQPHRQGTFKLSRDPAFADKVVDVVGLYLDPPDEAVVLCVDEKTQVQALDRTQPLLPIDFDRTEKRTHDYRRHGTTNLFAALEVGTGQVTARCFPKRRGEEFLAFMKHLAAAYPDRELHVVVDNLSTHTTDDVHAWLARHPRITFHFTPTGSSWLNMVETWFGIITRQAIRRGTFTSVRVLIRAIEDYVAAWNSDAKPFTWTATADEILAKVRWVHTEVRKLLTNNDK
jgi:transposase